jgi:hypothetical protein
MVVRPCSGLGGRQTDPLPYDPLSIIFLIDNHGSASSWPNLPRPSRDGCSSYCCSQRTLLRRAPPIGTALGVRRKKAARLAPFFTRDHWRLWRHFCVRARGGRADSLRRRRPYDYFLGNFLRTLATPEPIKDWSLTSLKEKLIKIGAKVVSHGRLAEVAIPRQMFQEILRLIAELRPQPPPALA